MNVALTMSAALRQDPRTSPITNNQKNISNTKHNHNLRHDSLFKQPAAKRHIQKNNNLIGIVQPKKNEKKSIPELYNIGCMGKITSLNETEDGRYSIILNGISRFKILDEVKNDKMYRECKISFGEFKDDIELQENKIKISDLEIIFRDLKNLFKKRGYVINWEELKKQNINQTINNLSMASPFSLEEKQALLETKDIFSRKNKFEEILKTYVLDNFSNTTIQ